MNQNVASFRSSSTEETQQFAAQLADRLQGGEVITLSGDLGAGKTTWTQGLAKGLGIKQQVNSPTFTIIKEYQDGRLPLYHMDAYRVEDEFEELGFEDYFYGSGVCVVEWAQNISEQLPQKRLDIYILNQGESLREIFLEPHGEGYSQWLGEVLK